METFEFPERPKPYPWTTPPDGTVEVVPFQYFVPYADKLEDALSACDQRIAELERENGRLRSEAQAYLDVQKLNVTDIALLRNALATTQAALDAKEKECERLEGVAGRHFDCYQDAITTRERYRKERDTALAAQGGGE